MLIFQISPANPRPTLLQCQWKNLKSRSTHDRGCHLVLPARATTTTTCHSVSTRDRNHQRHPTTSTAEPCLRRTSASSPSRPTCVRPLRHCTAPIINCIAQKAIITKRGGIYRSSRSHPRRTTSTTITRYTSRKSTTQTVPRIGYSAQARRVTRCSTQAR